MFHSLSFIKGVYLVKKNILLIASTALVAFFTQFAFAAIPAQPPKCPDVSSIHAHGVGRGTIELNHLWFAGTRSFEYSTPGIFWTFIIGNIKSPTAYEAFLKANNALSSLMFQAGPFYESEWERWTCVYATSEGYPAVAVTPILLTMDTNLAAYLKY
jgi:hypothetical protein